MNPSLLVSVGVPDPLLDAIVHRLRATERRRGRPWSRSLRQRLRIVCVALRTNLTFRELAAICATSRSQAHRIVADLVPRFAALLTIDPDRRHSWIVDGTLIPTRDHTTAAKSKNYRWSCNVQLLVRRDLRVIAVAGGGPGNRNDPIHYRDSSIEALCRFHGHVLADGGYRGQAHLSLHVSAAGKSFAIEPGDVIVDVALVLNTRLQDSRPGACFAITGAVDVTL
jgi:hypothetical protein